MSPDDVAAPVADLYRRWYARSGVPARKLLVEIRRSARARGSLPAPVRCPSGRPFRSSARPAHWSDTWTAPSRTTRSGSRCSLTACRASALAPPERWRAALARARKHGAFLGTRAKAFPEDFAVFARFYKELSALPERHPVAAAPAAYRGRAADRLAQRSVDRAFEERAPSIGGPVTCLGSCSTHEMSLGPGLSVNGERSCLSQYVAAPCLPGHSLHIVRGVRVTMSPQISLINLARR